jgi:hypothetical protein
MKRKRVTCCECKQEFPNDPAVVIWFIERGYAAKTYICKECYKAKLPKFQKDGEQSELR